MNKKLNQDHQPRILWNSNAPWAPTGYGMQTAQVVRRLKQNNYDLWCENHFNQIQIINEKYNYKNIAQKWINIIKNL